MINNKIKHIIQIILNSPPIIYFNFRMLPLRQAIHLPFFLYNPSFQDLSGKIILDIKNPTIGMIKIGKTGAGMYKKNCTILEIGGNMHFYGECFIGSNTLISIGRKGVCYIGKKTLINSGSRIICYHKIVIGNYTHIGWDVQMIDTDMHSMKNALTERKVKGYAPIILGEHCWIGNSSFILKSTTLPNYTIASCGSYINKKFKCEEKTLIGGNPAQILAEGCYYRDLDDDIIEYK
jgi:acetyltransferase-like isoleucine patch superfamily enzyme